MAILSKPYYPPESGQEIRMDRREPPCLSEWLHPGDVYEMLQNYQKFVISDPPKMPPSGSLFITKRCFLKAVRQDGHNWSKKQNEKKVKESHETLKVRGKPKLRCYYAHGEENENFQRRIYWMLEDDPMDMALVHYLEAKRKKKRSEKEEEILPELNECRQKPMIVQPILEGQNYLQIQDRAANFGDILPENFHIRFEEMLRLTSVRPNYNSSCRSEVLRLIREIKPLLKEDGDDWDQIPKLFSKGKISSEMADEKLLEKFLKEKFHLWLLQKAAEGGTDITVLDEGGLGVVHFAAAVGYDWALRATVAAGVDINFPDRNGLTACDWAAYCRREEMLTLLTEYNADTEAQSSLSKTPAALAYEENRENGKRSKKTKESEVEEVLPNPDNPGSPGALGEWIQFIDNEQASRSESLFINQNWSKFILLESFRNMLSRSPLDPIFFYQNRSKVKRFINKLESLKKRALEEKEISLEENLHAWFMQKLAEGGTGPAMIDKCGVGVIHLAAALDYDWAVEASIVAAEIDINLCDMNGCTALHWAAYYGRKTVVLLMDYDNVDIEARSSFGKTPAALAYDAGWRVIGDYLTYQKREPSMNYAEIIVAEADETDFLPLPCF